MAFLYTHKLAEQIDHIGFDLFDEPTATFHLVLVHPQNADTFAKAHPTANVKRVYWKTARNGVTWSYASITRRVKDKGIRHLFAGANPKSATTFMEFSE